jgi:NAD-dependent DNA ligase
MLPKSYFFDAQRIKNVLNSPVRIENNLTLKSRVQGRLRISLNDGELKIGVSGKTPRTLLSTDPNFNFSELDKSRYSIKRVNTSNKSGLVLTLNSIRTVKNSVRKFKALIKGGVYYVSYSPRLFLHAGKALGISPDVKMIADFIVEQNDAYHNGHTESLLTDAEFDAWEKVFEERGWKWPVKVGAKVSTPNTTNSDSSAKVKLPVKMGSLEKANTITEIDSWAAKIKAKTLVATPKLDGISVLLEYTNGKLSNAFTRGDGEEGKQILRHFNPKHMPKGIPYSIKTSGKVYVRGELLIPVDTFNKVFKKEFANPRNMMSGVLNSKTSNSSALTRATFYAFDMLGAGDTKAKQLGYMERLGFNTVPYKVIAATSELPPLLEKWKSLGVDMDGLVVETNNISDAKKLGLETNSINPKYARAYKPPRSDNLAQATVVKVEWKASRHGYLKPVVIVKPVKLAGVTVQRATGFNAAFIEENKIGKGSIVKLTRSGEVIPYIVGVVKKTKAEFPSKKQFGDYGYNVNRVEFVLKNRELSDDVGVQNILHFLTVCGVDRIKEETVRALFNAGFNTIQKVVSITKKQLLTVPRVSETTATRYLTEFEKLKSVPMHKLMHASNMFGHSMGSRRFLAIIDKFGDKALSWKGKSINEVANSIASVNGFSIKTGKVFAKGVVPFIRFKKSVYPYVIGVYAKKVKPKSSKLSGLSVAFTGFRSAEAEELIKMNGGKVATGVSRGVTHLLMSDPNSGSLKAQKARRLGIKTMSWDQFRKKFAI